jgi:hypothetical protein
MNIEDPERPGKRKFVNVTDQSGINKNRNPEKGDRVSDLVVMADVNNDSYQDVVSGIYYHRWEYISGENDHGDRAEVLLNDGAGNFNIVTNSGLNTLTTNGVYGPGLIDAVGYSFLDYDQDGNIDYLYIATKFIDYAQNIKMPDILLRGNGDGTFTRVTNSGIDYVVEPMYGVTSTDWNNDGLPDIVTSPYCRSGGSLFRNNGNGTFTDVSAITGYDAQFLGGDSYIDENGQKQQQPMCQWECITGDFDNDGDIDFLHILVHGGYQEGEGHSVLAVNQGPPDYKFKYELKRINRDIPEAAHLGDYAGAMFDMNNDCWLDMAICQGHYYPAADRLYLFLQDPETNTFNDVTSSLGLKWIKNPSAFEALDYDLDGDQDFVVYYDSIEGTAPTTLLMENRIGNQNNWVSVKLDAPPNCNQNALGARVILSSNGINQIREIQTGLGHFGGQQPYILNFGLAQFNYIDSITVLWPIATDRKTVVYNPPTNMIIEIEKAGYKGYVKNFTGAKPAIAFDKPFIDFDTVKVNETYTQSFSIKNIGDADLHVTNVSLKYNDGFYQIIDNPGSFVLQPGSERAITVKFLPLQRLSYPNGVVFTSDAFNGSAKMFELKGQGFDKEPMITCSEYKILFDTTRVNLERNVVITNSGEETLDLTSFSITDDADDVYDVEGTLVSLEPGETTTIKVKFNPVHRKIYTAKLIIESNAFNKPSVIIPITGISDVPTPTLSYTPSSLLYFSVNIGSSKDKFLNLMNNGDGILVIDSIVFQSDKDAFEFKSVNFPIELDSAASTSLTLTFTPKEAKNYELTAIIYSNSYPESEHSLTITGKGNLVNDVEDIVTLDGIEVSIHPNPVLGNDFSIDCTSNEPTECFELTIIDFTGKTCKSIFSGSLPAGFNEFKVVTDDLPSGSYFISFGAGYERNVVPFTILK